MALGDVLFAKGLVTKEDIERGVEYQREHGGRFGECLIALDIISAEAMKAALDEVPTAPRNLDDIDIDATMLLQIMIKTMYTLNVSATSQIANVMKLPSTIVSALVKEGMDGKLIESGGQPGSGDERRAEVRYTLGGKGREWAVDLVEQCRYFGPVPVSLEAFRSRVNRQKISNEWVNQEAMEAAFKDMVMPSRFLSRLGPAINSDGAVLIYGQAGNGKTTIAEIVGEIFRDVVYIPYCFEVDGQIVKVFDPSVHKPIDEDADSGGPRRLRLGQTDKRWVPCSRPFVVTGGELTLKLLDLSFNEISKFYEAPLQTKALNGTFLIDDFGRQRVKPEEILNRWIVPLASGVDYLSLHTGKMFELPFNELVIFSTNLRPSDLMDPAFQRRISYKVKTMAPTDDLFRETFDDMARKHGLELSDEIFQQVVESIRTSGDSLAYFQPIFIVKQVLASCKFANTPARFTHDNVEDALLNLSVDEDDSDGLGGSWHADAMEKIEESSIDLLPKQDPGVA